MSKPLTFRDDKVLNFIFSKLVSLEAELDMQRAITLSAYKLLNRDGKIAFSEIVDEVEFSQPHLWQSRLQVLRSELYGMSDDFDDLLDNILNPKS